MKFEPPAEYCEEDQADDLMSGEVVSTEGKKYVVLPYKWHPSRTQGLEVAFKEVACTFLQELKNSPPEERQQHCQDLSARFPTPTFFDHNLPTPREIQYAESVQVKLLPENRFDLTQWKQEGWHGKSMKDYKNIDFEKPFPEEDFIRMFLSVKVLVHNHQRHLEQQSAESLSPGSQIT